MVYNSIRPGHSTNIKNNVVNYNAHSKKESHLLQFVAAFPYSRESNYKSNLLIGTKAVVKQNTK